MFLENIKPSAQFRSKKANQMLGILRKGQRKEYSPINLCINVWFVYTRNTSCSFGHFLLSRIWKDTKGSRQPRITKALEYMQNDPPYEGWKDKVNWHCALKKEVTRREYDRGQPHHKWHGENGWALTAYSLPVQEPQGIKGSPSEPGSKQAEIICCMRESSLLKDFPDAVSSLGFRGT